MSILFFWLERGGRWGWSQAFNFFLLERGGGRGLSPLTCPANHQNLNVIQKWAFYFFDWRGVADGVWVQWLARMIIRSWMLIQKWVFYFWLERGDEWVSSPLTSLADHQKLNVIQKWAFNFLTAEGWWIGFESIDQPSQSSEVKRNPKMSILFFWLERGGRRVSSPSTSPADHQKLNIIQKWAFYFFAGEGWQMGFESIDQPGWSSEVECNPKMSI